MATPHSLSLTRDSLTYDCDLCRRIAHSTLFDRGFSFVATEVRKIIMFGSNNWDAHAGRKVVRPQYLLSLFTALAFALAIHPGKPRRGVTDDLEVTIPSSSMRGTPNFPQATTACTPLDNSDLSIMESQRRRICLRFSQVRETEA